MKQRAAVSSEITVDEATRRATTHCDKHLSCLAEPATPLCRVKQCVQGKVHFIECVDRLVCSYRMSFGNAFVCNCPVRKEIYDQYGI